MTMYENNPWDRIHTPSSDFTVLRVANTRGVPIYWGKDHLGHCLLIILLEGDHTCVFRDRQVSLRGIDVDLRNTSEHGAQNVVLTLAHHADQDLFLGLCQTLIKVLSDVSAPGTALAITLTHLKRWKAFLSGRNQRVLSAEEIRGLYGELYILRSLYKNNLSHSEAVEAWCGPDRSQQDFIFQDRAIEVKTLSSRARNLVTISSEDQLESIAEELYLVTLKLSEMPEQSQAQSLNDFVGLVESELANAAVKEEFSDKLATAGYVPITEYDNPKFIVHKARSYLVSDEFPRLVRSDLRPGVMNVSYDITLESLEPFSHALDAIAQGT